MNERYVSLILSVACLFREAQNCSMPKTLWLRCD